MSITAKWKEIANALKNVAPPIIEEKTVEQRLEDVEKTVSKIVEVVEIPTEGG